MDFNPVIWFACAYCKKAFNSIDELKEHKVKQHSKDTKKIHGIVFQARIVDANWDPVDEVATNTCEKIVFETEAPASIPELDESPNVCVELDRLSDDCINRYLEKSRLSRAKREAAALSSRRSKVKPIKLQRKSANKSADNDSYVIAPKRGRNERPRSGKSNGIIKKVNSKGKKTRWGNRKATSTKVARSTPFEETLIPSHYSRRFSASLPRPLNKYQQSRLNSAIDPNNEQKQVPIQVKTGARNRKQQQQESRIQRQSVQEPVPIIPSSSNLQGITVSHDNQTVSAMFEDGPKLIDHVNLSTFYPNLNEMAEPRQNQTVIDINEVLNPYIPNPSMSSDFGTQTDSDYITMNSQLMTEELETFASSSSPSLAQIFLEFPGPQGYAVEEVVETTNIIGGDSESFSSPVPVPVHDLETEADLNSESDSSSIIVITPANDFHLEDPEITDSNSCSDIEGAPLTYVQL